MKKLNLFYKTITVILASALLLSGCGFKLRGSHYLPEVFKSLSVQSFDQHSELTRLVKQQLIANDVTLTDSSTATQLRLIKDNLDRRTLTLFPNGQVAEYELIYSVFYEVMIPGKESQSFNFEIYRDYQDDPDKALAKSRELNVILKEMRVQAANRVIRQLASIKTTN